MVTRRFVRIDQIEIENYKGIEHVLIEFHRQRLLGEPDVFVLGSRNGLGKTSIMECCAFLLMAVSLKKRQFSLETLRRMGFYVDVADLIIHAGESVACIRGRVSSDAITLNISIEINRKGVVQVGGDEFSYMLDNSDASPAALDEFVRVLVGMTPNPFLGNAFCFFHGHRKVQEGRPELGMMLHNAELSNRPFYRRMDTATSAFKITVLRNKMGIGNVLELESDDDPQAAMAKLDEIINRYAGVSFAKLKPMADNSLDFRVHRCCGEETEASYPFDGLSTGQKEIIATLFLIWQQTHKNPSVVFIDEPELHLNAQWHRGFVSSLQRLAPDNQYILATHSEDVMASVIPSSRIMLNETE